MKRLVTSLACAAMACGGAPPYVRDGGAVGRLATHSVDWNPTHADVGRVVAVADRGSDVAVFADGAATVFDASAVSLVDRSVSRWTGAATIPAADGGISWIVGIDDRGRVRRLRARTGFEDVSARWGLDSSRVLGAAPLGDRAAVFLLKDELAVADGARVVRLGGVPLTALSAGGGVSAGIAAGAVVRLDPAQRSSRVYDFGNAVDVAVDEGGQVYAATPDAVYAENARGDLELCFRATLGQIHGLVASRGRVWFAEGPEIGAIEAQGDKRSIVATVGSNLPVSSRLWPSTSGDVWLVADGKLTRIARDVPAAVKKSAEDSWRSEIAPVFARVCAKCHMAGGPAGIDLSTFAAWQGHRSEIKERVLDFRSMPPRGHPISDADFDAIRAWVSPPR